MNIIDVLIKNTLNTRNPTVVGLDPDLIKIPACYKNINGNEADPLKEVADVIFTYNKDIIDTIFDIVPAVKPQIAFYEKYGSFGVRAFEKTVRYAKCKGLVVIEDGKRNDIGNTAQAYADGHLGVVEALNGNVVPSINADFLTVSPFLGRDSLTPFIDVCKSNNKGIFVLVKTSNKGSGEIQDVVNDKGQSISGSLAEYINSQATYAGEYGYSPIGAVVGATYPEEADVLRNAMPRNYFLVPGYGAQGGGAKDIINCFNSDGLGAIVNSSRGILYTHMTDEERMICTREEYLNSVRKATIQMRDEIYSELFDNYSQILY